MEPRKEDRGAPTVRPVGSDIESDRVFGEPAEIRALDFDDK